MGRGAPQPEAKWPQAGQRALLAGKGVPLGGWATLPVGRAWVPGALGHQQQPGQLSAAAGGVAPPTREGPQGLRVGGPRDGGGLLGVVLQGPGAGGSLSSKAGGH